MNILSAKRNILVKGGVKESSITNPWKNWWTTHWSNLAFPNVKISNCGNVSHKDSLRVMETISKRRYKSIINRWSLRNSSSRNWRQYWPPKYNAFNLRSVWPLFLLEAGGLRVSSGFNQYYARYLTSQICILLKRGISRSKNSSAWGSQKPWGWTLLDFREEKNTIGCSTSEREKGSRKADSKHFMFSWE